MGYKITWTDKAEIEQQQILDFWTENNKSKTFSLKLAGLFKAELELVSKRPNIGRKTRLKNVRFKLVRDYQIFYEILEKEIRVVAIWDARRNPKSLKIR